MRDTSRGVSSVAVGRHAAISVFCVHPLLIRVKYFLRDAAYGA
jgi:hypothetical protein